MARRTSQPEFSGLLAAARSAIPDLAVTTDIIVGFPGETEAEFEESLAFVEEMAFARLHIFRYSPREGTAAAGMQGQVSPQAAQVRSQQMHRLNAQLEESFRAGFVGRRMPVLWESSEPYGFGQQWSGLTDNYLRVVTITAPQTDLHNQIIETELVDTMPAAILGQVPASLPMQSDRPDQPVLTLLS
jgi:threonylcarbamoyladenosine tRNA methylthiotransferase MtaB